MLTLDLFEEKVGQAILTRGKQYFKKGRVGFLEETEKGHWVARVEGTEMYDAEVYLEKDETVSEWLCNCAYDGPVCKHIVAVLLAIRQEAGKPGKAKAAAPKKPNFESLIEKVSLSEFQDFVRHYAAGNKSFRTEFELWFAEKDAGIDVEKHYALLIKNVVRRHDSGGFIEYREVPKLNNDLKQLLHTGFEQARKKSFNGAFGLAKALLRATIEAIDTSDDSNGYLAGTMSETIGFIEQIINDPDAGMALREAIFEFLKTELNNSLYFGYADFGYELFALFRQLAVTLGAHEPFLNFVDSKLARSKRDFDEYEHDFFTVEKIEFLAATGYKAEAEKLLSQNMDIVEVRQMEVEKKVAVKDFAAAKKIIADGIKIAKAKGYPGTVDNWKKELLKIAVLEKDIETVRAYTKQFAFDRGFDAAYYNQWKNTYAPQEWKAVLETQIADAIGAAATKERKQRGAFHNGPGRYVLDVLAPIYIEEKYWHRLMALVENANDFELAWQYHSYLFKEYPQQLLAVYLKGIEGKADMAGTRSDYADLARKMKKIMRDIPQGKEAVLEAARTLRSKYARRPAMVEELNRIIY